MPIEVTFLRDRENGGQEAQPSNLANELAKFINAAKSSLHIAIYDFRLTGELFELVIGALHSRADAGIEVQIAFDHGKPDTNTFNPFIEDGGDPAPKGTKAFLEGVFPKESNVEIKSIAGSKLMHNKYIVRDVNTLKATLWTGSANFTDDAWTFQENNILQIPSPELCAFYETDFQELWVSGDIKTTGINDSGTVEIGKTGIDVAFAPGEGKTIDHTIASLISSARHRIKIASMVLTSHTILGALEEALHFKQVREFGGIYDQTQMSGVVKQWQKSRKSTGIIQTFEDVASHLKPKKSLPFSKTSRHNFMHNKVAVCDDAVVTGSFNFSHSATQNAENTLVLHDKKLADEYSDYIDKLIAQYGNS